MPKNPRNQWISHIMPSGYWNLLVCRRRRRRRAWHYRRLCCHAWHCHRLLFGHRRRLLVWHSRRRLLLLPAAVAWSSVSLGLHNTAVSPVDVSLPPSRHPSWRPTGQGGAPSFHCTGSAPDSASWRPLPPQPQRPCCPYYQHSSKPVVNCYVSSSRNCSKSAVTASCLLLKVA
jgi:hypothetical protein